MEMKLYRQNWVTLSQEVRTKLAEVFKLRRDEGTEVIDGKIVSDGHSDQALESINVKSMQEYTGSKEKDFVELFKLTMTKAMTKEEVKPIAEVYKEPLTERDVAVLNDANRGDKPKADYGKVAPKVVKPKKVK